MGMSMAAKRRHWKEKDGRLWARLSIPNELRPWFGNKTQLTEPLGGDRRIADRNHSAAVARLQDKLAEARAARSETPPVPSPPPSLRNVTTDDQSHAAWHHYQGTLAGLEEKRSRMPTSAEIDAEHELLMQRIESGEADPARGIASIFNLYTDYELKAGARHFDKALRVKRLEALRRALPLADYRLVEYTVRQHAQIYQLNAAPGTEGYDKLAQALMRAEIEALRRTIEYDDGDAGGQPTDPLVRPPQAKAEPIAPVSLKTLFEDYVQSRQAVGYHLDGGANWGSPVESLIKHLGHSDARRITRLDLLAWRDSLIKSGLSAKTVSDKHLAAIRAVLTWGYDNARLPTNEAEKVKQDVPKRIRSREAGFTDAEAVEILKTSLAYMPSQPTNRAN